jgi:hypothetical protein
MRDVNADGLVNTFNLVIVTGNCGQAAVAAASYMLAEVELSTDQAHQTISAAVQSLGQFTLGRMDKFKRWIQPT